VNSATANYKLCLRCLRAVPLESEEFYCSNDGERLLECCPRCAASILSPYAHYCVKCGTPFGAHPARSGALWTLED